ncbi:hypothetical protein M0R45_021281 [Rubus argutus]|uniref:Uncharacterized protein n=1 Tax=Rubus argutus TaxID=59490 RepID=A0AAW1XEH3_RUBAR
MPEIQSQLSHSLTPPNPMVLIRERRQLNLSLPCLNPPSDGHVSIYLFIPLPPLPLPSPPTAVSPLPSLPHTSRNSKS